MKIKIPSIDKLIKNYEGKSIALIVGELDIDNSYESYKKTRIDGEDVAWHKLRNREDAFLARVESRGARVTSLVNIPLDMTKYDIAIFTGEVVYQNVGSALRLKGRFQGDIFVEFFEECWNSVSATVLRKKIANDPIWIQNRLCYLTATAKTPSVIEI